MQQHTLNDQPQGVIPQKFGGIPRRWIVILTVVIYTAVFYILYGLTGRGIGALAILPVILIGWIFGLKGGMIAAALSFPLTFLLLHVLGEAALYRLITEAGGIAGTLALLVIGAIVGRLSELSKKVKQELAERKAAETELRETRDFLVNIIESSLDCIVVADSKGDITQVNRAFLNMLGFTEDEVLGKSMYDFFIKEVGTYNSTTGRTITLDQDFYDATIQKVQELIKGGTISNWEACYLNKNNQVIPVEQNVVFLFNKQGGRMGAVGIIRDITKRKQAEEALMETSQTLVALIKASPLAIVVMDTAGNITMWNPAAEQIFGWAEQEVRDRPFPFFKEESREDWRRMFESVVEGKAVRDEEMRRLKKDGAFIDISVSSAPLRDNTGEVTAVMAIMSDITEQKRLQKEIILVSGREQRRIGQDLHDGLGQVLTGVTFLSRVLEQKLTSKSLAEATEAAEITRLVNKAISQTRNLSRGLYPATLESDGLMAALEELAAGTENTFNISCNFTYNKPVFIDDVTVAVHLYRIVLESINNATRHGKAQNITISLDTIYDKCILTIKDDGVGMDEPPTHGKGMGITLMNYRARMIGAALVVQGAPGEGTIVTCTFQANTNKQGEAKHGRRTY